MWRQVVNQICGDEILMAIYWFFAKTLSILLDTSTDFSEPWSSLYPSRDFPIYKPDEVASIAPEDCPRTQPTSQRQDKPIPTTPHSFALINFCGFDLVCVPSATTCPFFDEFLTRTDTTAVVLLIRSTRFSTTSTSPWEAGAKKVTFREDETPRVLQ